jgi:IS5 family transposase
MRPRERRETGEQDMFRSRLDQVIDMDHALAKLARTIDWGFLEEKFGEVYKDGAGQPPLPTRLMAGLAILKHTYNLRGGSRTPITNTSAARSFSSTGCRSIVPR